MVSKLILVKKINFLFQDASLIENLSVEENLFGFSNCGRNISMDKIMNLLYEVEELYTAVEEFAYIHDNHVRLHSYNSYITPYEASYGLA